jgi:hypothetical protein
MKSLKIVTGGPCPDPRAFRPCAGGDRRALPAARRSNSQAAYLGGPVEWLLGAAIASTDGLLKGQ